MSKDLVNWQMQCITEEIFYLNDRIIQGDYSENVALKKAKTLLADHQASIEKWPGMLEADTDVALVYGGFIKLYWKFRWSDGEVQSGSLIPIRK